MNRGLRFFIAMVVASLAAPAVYAAYLYSYLLSLGGSFSGVLVVLAIAWLVCLAHLVILGVPVFIFLKRRNRLRWSTVSVSGFLTGALPLGLLGYPSPLSGYSSSANWHGKHVNFYENGEPTRYAWFSHIESSLLFGILGVVAALVLWRLWHVLGSHRTPDAADA